MIDNDEIILENAKESVFTLDKAYRRAVNNGNLDEMIQLKPKLDEAFNLYSIARLNLLMEGTLANDQDVAAMRRIRAAIDQAAAIESLIAGAVKLIGFIAKFA
jgi:hypothetical protein